MKQKIERTNTSTKRFSVRTIAMVLSIVMLIGSIATGSMLSTFAAYLKDAAANSDAVSQAATEGGDIALNAIPSEDTDTTPDNETVDNANAVEDNEIETKQNSLSDFEENAIVRGMKQDLVYTGANVNISSIGAEKKENYNFSGHTINLFIESNSGTVNGSTGDKYIGLTQYSGEWYQAKSIYMETNTSGSGKWNYYFKVEPYGSNWGDWLSFSHDTTGATFSPAVNNNYQLSWDWYKNGNNDTLALPVSSSGYLRMDFDTKGNDNGHGWIRWTANAVSALSGGALNAVNTTMYDGGTTTTLSTTNPSGGSGSYTPSAYSVTRISGDSSATASVSGNTFTAPASVSTATVFQVSCTFTDTNCPNLTRTVTREITVNPTPTYTATVSDSGTAETETAAAHISTSSSTEGSATTQTVTQGTKLYVYTNQKSGYAANVTVTKAGGGTVSVNRNSAKKFSFDMPDEDVTVSVTYGEAQAVPVKIFAGVGGSVSVTYGTRNFAVEAGNNATIQVLEGDTISLTATPGNSHSFSKWKKNLNSEYSTTATLTNESIYTDMVYVASFNTTAAHSGWYYTKDNSAATPEFTNSSTYKFAYSSSDTGVGTDNHTIDAKKDSADGHGYWADLTTALTANNKKLFFALSTTGSNTNIVGNTSIEINDASKSAGNTVEMKSGNKVLFKVQVKENSNVSSYKRYLYIYDVDDSVTQIGVQAYDNGNSQAADYRFFYQTGSSSTEEPSFTPNITFYAKDGVIRRDYTTTGMFGSTSVTEVSGAVEVTKTNESFGGTSTGTWDEGNALKGNKITVTTQVGDDYKADYYVRGFSFNGVTPQVFDWRDDGTYTCTYDIPADMEEDKLEITPIYYLKDDSNTITFYVEGYNDTVKTAWGHTLFVYPFYQYYKNGSSGDKTTYQGQAGNFRGYPGQPVINYGGQRSIQIPLTDDGTAGGYRVKGVTINNGYWDHVHGDTRGDGDGHDNNDTMGADFVTVHRQTYDYDDFYKIYNEYGKTADNLNNIFFTFKYTTDHQHRGDYDDDSSHKTDQNADNAAALTSSNFATHKWEQLKDNFQRPVDLFGNVLTDEQQNANKMYVISEGYEANNAGKFATEWAIYDNSANNTYNKITVSNGKTSIVPSVLKIASADRVSDAQYPALDGDLTTSDYKAIYQALEPYKYRPVYICYESELHGGSKEGGYDPAYRSDGLWTFTKKTDFIKGEVKIEYINEQKHVTTYTTDEFKSGSNVGTVTGCSAYFTYNADESGYDEAQEGKTALADLRINDKKYFNFEANTSGSYEFMGWYYVDSNGDYHPVNNDPKKMTGHSAMSSDGKFVARFMFVQSGSLSISHGLKEGNNGRGDTYLGVYVDDTPIAKEATNTGAVKLDSTVINSANTTSEIRVVLRTVAKNSSNFSKFTAQKTDETDTQSDIESGTTFFKGNNVTSGTETVREFTFNVSDLFDTGSQKVLALDYFSELSGTLKILHNLSSASPSGSATCTVKAEILDSTGNNIVATYEENPLTNSVTISDGAHLNRELSYKIRVTLYTELADFKEFTEYRAFVDNHDSALSNGTNVKGGSSCDVAHTYPENSRTVSATVVFNVSSLYNSDGVQTTTTLPFYSVVTAPEYKYSIRYFYNAYNPDFGAQAYTVNGTFTETELNTYMNLTGVKSQLAFKDNDDRKTFISDHAPYEDNFMQTIKYTVTDDSKYRSYDGATHTMSLVVEPYTEARAQASVTFILPYQLDDSIPYPTLNHIKKNNDGNVEKSDPETHTPIKVNVWDWCVIDGKKNKDGAGGDPVFVQAPLIVYDSGTPKYFEYWTVKTNPSATTVASASYPLEYTRCYNPKFNLAIFQDCIVEPHYGDTMRQDAVNYTDYDKFNVNAMKDADAEAAAAAGADNGITIAFMENSRNQYNAGDYGIIHYETDADGKGTNPVYTTKMNVNRQGAGDRTYSDFLLSFNNVAGNRTLNELGAGKMKAGLIIEPVANLAKNQNGEYYTESEESYKTQYGANISDIASKGKSNISSDLTTAISTSKTGYLKSEFDVTELDNKNRIQWYYSIANKSHVAGNASAEDKLADRDYLNNTHYVYRAYAYIYTVGEGGEKTDIKISQTPTYFTIYDMAMIGEGYYK
jgi:hypothetical protein